MYQPNDIADKIKETAKTKNTSVRSVLLNCGLGYNLMAGMKTSYPRSDNLVKIADYLDVSVDYLLGRTNDPNSHK